MAHPAESHVPVRLTGELKAMQFDEATPSVWYWGFARIGTTTGEDSWQIRRLLVGPGGDLVVQWADGDAEFDNIWDNRASLTYA